MRASRAVPDMVERLGGTAHMNRVGHAFFKVRMRDEGGAFGGEVSGHYYFADFYNADSGTVPALLILELLSKKDAKLSELRRAVPLASTSSPARSTPRSTTPTPSMAAIEERYADGEITKLDGVSVDYDDWHFNVRPSNTEPLLRLNLESLVSTRGHGAPARRGAAADPLVSGAIHRIAIPTPFMVGRVNCYLIEDDPLTLVDTGPNSGKALDELERALARARPPDRGPRADRHHPPAHRPPRAGRHARPALGRRGGARSTCSRP